MTAMPELVAGFHSLVGLAAVFVAIAAFLNPGAFNLGSPGNIKLGSLIEMSIGAAVGAITFSGSIIAFLKLQGIMSGSPITFKRKRTLPRTQTAPRLRHQRKIAVARILRTPRTIVIAVAVANLLRENRRVKQKWRMRMRMRRSNSSSSSNNTKTKRRLEEASNICLKDILQRHV